MNAGQLDEVWSMVDREYLAEVARRGPAPVFAAPAAAPAAAAMPAAAAHPAAVADEDAGAPLGGWRRHRHNLETKIGSQLGGARRSPDRTNALTLDHAVTLALDTRSRQRAGGGAGSADAG